MHFLKLYAELYNILFFYSIFVGPNLQACWLSWFLLVSRQQTVCLKHLYILYLYICTFMYVYTYIIYACICMVRLDNALNSLIIGGKVVFWFSLQLQKLTLSFHLNVCVLFGIYWVKKQTTQKLVSFISTLFSNFK